LQRTPEINSRPTEQNIKGDTWELLRAEIKMYRETAERIEVAEDVRERHTVASTQRLFLLSSAGVTPTSEVRVLFVLLTLGKNIFSRYSSGGL
jgi:hypothetical protein